MTIKKAHWCDPPRWTDDPTLERGVSVWECECGKRQYIEYITDIGDIQYYSWKPYKGKTQDEI